MESILQFIESGGFVMYPLLLLSFVAGVVIIERLIAFRELGSVSPGLVGEVVKACNDGDYESAERACAARRGPVAASLSVILKHRNAEPAVIERQVEEAGQAHFTNLEKYLSVLDTTTTISPLLGLLGTIVGMIGTFNSISAVQASGGNNDGVLHGVAEALYATASGITVAIVCFIAYNYFSSRIRFIISETEMAATKLLNVLESNRKASEPISRSVSKAGEKYAV